MFLNTRTWLFVVTILLVAEDFQYMLKVGPSALEQIEKQQEDFQEDGKEKGGENSNEKEDEKKEEKKDENKNDDSESLLNASTWLAKNKFRDAFYLLSDTAHELESPPPERI